MKLKKLDSVNFNALQTKEMKNVFGGRPKYCVNSTTSGGSADRL